MVLLRLLGSPSIVRDDGSLVGGGAAQRHRIALLALLAIAGEHGMSRERLMTYLWPDREASRARQLLNQSVYCLRQSFGDDALRSAGDGLRLDRGVIATDVDGFESALERGDPAGAVELYRGPFLDGFSLPGATDFEHWSEQERARLAAIHGRVMELLAESARQASDPPAPVAEQPIVSSSDDAPAIRPPRRAMWYGVAALVISGLALVTALGLSRF